MALVAIADWKTMYEDEADTLRGYQRALFGGSPNEAPDATQKRSPCTGSTPATDPPCKRRRLSTRS